MSTFTQEISPARPSSSYLRVLREHWRLIAAITILCVGVAFLSQAFTTPSYTASSDLLISPVDASDNTFVGINVFRNTSSDPTSNVLTLARYLKTPATAEIVKARLQLPDSPGQLLNAISVQPLSQTNIVSIVASARSARLSAALGNAFADATVARRSRQVQTDVGAIITRLQAQLSRSKSSPAAIVLPIQQRLASLRSLISLPDPTVSVLNRADVPTSANRTSLKLIAIASGLAGLLLGFGVALVADSVGGKIRREDELMLRQRLPILARVPRLFRSTIDDYLAGRANLPPAAWEAYRTLRANIVRSVKTGPPAPVIVVTSAMGGEGKTMTAVNLAESLAAQDLRVILVDGDFRRPMIASIFGVPSPRDGFTSAFIEGNVSAALREAPGNARLRLLLPTLRAPQQIDQLDAAGVRRAFDALRATADVVVVDSAPAVDVSDALLLGHEGDMVLIAVRLGFSRRDKFEALRAALAQHGVTPAGLVVTVRDRPSLSVEGSATPIAVDLNPLQRVGYGQRPGSNRRAVRAWGGE
jgi:Mrp family chromosome partitioning ATPase/capsular polysaccharide biosynthesis protein